MRCDSVGSVLPALGFGVRALLRASCTGCRCMEEYDQARDCGLALGRLLRIAGTFIFPLSSSGNGFTPFRDPGISRNKKSAAG